MLPLQPARPVVDGIQDALLALVISAVLGFVISECYRLSNREIAHSQSFMHAAVLTVIIACIVTRAVNSIETAFLAGGALAVLRFRTVMKDAREFSFIFLAIAAGIGVGTRHYVIVVIGTVASALLTYALHRWQYGRHPYPPYQLSMKAHTSELANVRAIIAEHTVRADWIGSQKVAEGIGTFRFEILLTDSQRAERLLHALQNVGSASDITLNPWKRFSNKDAFD